MIGVLEGATGTLDGVTSALDGIAGTPEFVKDVPEVVIGALEFATGVVCTADGATDPREAGLDGCTGAGVAEEITSTKNGFELESWRPRLPRPQLVSRVAAIELWV